LPHNSRGGASGEANCLVHTVPAMLDALGSNQSPKDAFICRGNTHSEVRCDGHRNWFRFDDAAIVKLGIQVPKIVAVAVGAAALRPMDALRA
jgi:hypothetical protein